MSIAVACGGVCLDGAPGDRPFEAFAMIHCGANQCGGGLYSLRDVDIVAGSFVDNRAVVEGAGSSRATGPSLTSTRAFCTLTCEPGRLGVHSILGEPELGVVPVRPGEPVSEPAQPVEPLHPVVPMQLVKPIQPGDAVQPVRPGQLVRVKKPLSGQRLGAQPLEGGVHGGTGQPAKPVKPVAPIPPPVIPQPTPPIVVEPPCDPGVKFAPLEFRKALRARSSDNETTH